MAKRIITAAITGAINVPTQSEYLPITTKQIADEAVRACEAGAAVAHIHVRDQENGRPSADLGMFREVCESIKSRCDVVLCITTGGDPMSMTVPQRLAPVTDLSPELASFNSGTFNFAVHRLLDKYKEEDFKFDWEYEHLKKSENTIHSNTFLAMREYLDVFDSCQVKPEFEVYDLGQINNIKMLMKGGKIKGPVYLQFILGITGGLPATVENLVYMVETAKKTFGEDNFVWSVVGAGSQQLPMAAAALAMGGNLRVGLEDSIWIAKGVKAKSNAEQVEKVKGIAEALSIEIATPDEAREMLGLKGIQAVNY